MRKPPGRKYERFHYHRSPEIALVRAAGLVPFMGRSEVGKRLGITKQAVKLIEEKALHTIVRRLRQDMTLHSLLT